MIATLVVIPLLIVFKKASDGGGEGHMLVVAPQLHHSARRRGNCVICGAVQQAYSPCALLNSFRASSCNTRICAKYPCASSMYCPTAFSSSRTAISRA